MNHLDWEHAPRGQRRDLDPKQWTGVEGDTGSVSMTSSERDPYWDYSRYPPEEPHTSMGEADTVQWENHSPASHSQYSKESTVVHPNGEPLEMSEEDQELARKRRQLQEIEEQIVMKKTAIALIKVVNFAKKNKRYRPFTEETEDVDIKADMSMKSNEPFMQLVEEKEAGFSNSEQSAACKGATLKDRVNVILQQKHPLGFRTKVHSPSSDIPNSTSLSKDGLWLEDHPLKLRVKALMRKRCNSCVLQSNGEVPDVKPPPSKRPNPTVPEEDSISKGFQRFLTVLNKGVDIDLLAKIVTDDSEDLPVGEEQLNIQPPILENESNVRYRSESQGSHSGALQQDHCRSNSGERRTEITNREGSHKERHSEESEEKFIKSNDVGGDSHSGLSSSLKSPPAVEEKKIGGKVEDQNAQLQNILQVLGLSLDVDEMSKLADRTQERLYGKKPDDRQSVNDRAETETQQMSSAAAAAAPAAAAAAPAAAAPAAAAALPEYNSAQYSEYTAYSSSANNGAASSTWEYTHDDVPSFPCSSAYQYPQNPSHHFSGLRASAGGGYSNPDLSLSEGQIGGRMGSRCLQVVKTISREQVNRNRTTFWTCGRNTGHFPSGRTEEAKERRRRGRKKYKLNKQLRMESEMREMKRKAREAAKLELDLFLASVEANIETQLPASVVANTETQLSASVVANTETQPSEKDKPFIFF